MDKDTDSQETDAGGVLSSYQFLTLYFPAFVLTLGYSIATPAIPVFAKSFDTGFAVASLVIVVHALGGLIAAGSISSLRHAAQGLSLSKARRSNRSSRRTIRPAF